MSSSGKKSPAHPASSPHVTYEQCVKTYGGLPVETLCTDMSGHPSGSEIGKIVVHVPKSHPKPNGPKPSKKRSRKNRTTRKQRRS